MRKANSLEKTLMLTKTEGRRRRRQQRMRWLDGINESTDMSLSQCWEIVKDREARHAAIHGLRGGHNSATKQIASLSDIYKCFSQSHFPILPGCEDEPVF